MDAVNLHLHYSIQDKEFSHAKILFSHNCSEHLQFLALDISTILAFLCSAV
jgi:hypothetical protein